MKNIISICLFVFAFISGNSQEDKKPLVTADQVDNVFKDWNNEDRPGIAIGIVKNGKIDHLRGYGSANLEHNVMIDPVKTKFLFPGMSDQMICFLAFQLEDSNQISLNDPVSKYLDNIPFGNKIKIHHLINHTSGLNDVAMMKPMVGFSEFESFDYENLISVLSIQKELSENPGVKYVNNKTEIRILQAIIEKVSGKSIAEYADTQIFEPLNMNNSLFTSNASEVIANKAQAYVPIGENFQRIKTILDETHPSLFYSTVEDICKWATNFSRIRIGNQNIIDKMEMICSENGKSMTIKNSAQYQGQQSYWDYKGTKKLHLIGQKYGYACKLVRFPDQDLSIVVMGNAGDYNGYMSSYAADLYLENFYKIKDHDSEEAVQNVELSKTQLEKYCGKYWENDVCFTTIITLVNDTLRYKEIENGRELDLVPTSKNSFVGNYGQEISFYQEAGEQILKLVVGKSSTYHSALFDDVSWTSNLSRFKGDFKNKKLGVSYSAIMVGDKLILKHSKLGEFEMFPLSKNKFRINDRKLRCVTFSEDADSFTLSNSKIKDVEFVRDDQEFKM